MSDHMTEWLSAYLDGELHGIRLHRVEAHLAECRDCRAELQSLKDLSAVLHESGAPKFNAPERFIAQVNLRLPHQRARASRSKAFEIGWWMIPIGIMTLWIFMSTAFVVRDMISAAAAFGWVGSVPAWVIRDPSAGVYWSVAFGQAGLLSGNSLQWAQETESFIRTAVPQLTWQVSIALLYLSWIAIWWARHTRQGYGQPAESWSGPSVE